MAAAISLPAQTPSWTSSLIDRVRGASFQEISNLDIQARSFHSTSDFFRARFRWPDFFRPGSMRYVLFVNPAVNTVAVSDPAAVEAILAHELEHICYYSGRSRWRNLGLVRLWLPSRQASWERATDERAIERGYGPGLIRYREWLYRNVPTEVAKKKRRIYLTPREIGQRPPSNSAGGFIESLTCSRASAQPPTSIRSSVSAAAARRTPAHRPAA